jgi:pimeloyl-ACP methyl ester carboxylesterase
MGGSAQWDGCRDTLQQHADVIAVDLPGFGANAHLPPIDSIGGYADWVVQRLRSLGVEDYHLLGHSMGGMIAQEIALRDPERINRLVLYATGAIGVLPGRFETIELSKKRAAEDGAAATARRIAATWFLDREAAPGYEHCAAIAVQTTLPALEAGLDAMQAWSGEQNLPQIQQETLVLWGDKDRTYPWSQIQMLWETIPNTSLAIVPSCAHALHVEKPDLFQRLVSDFLDL